MLKCIVKTLAILLFLSTFSSLTYACTVNNLTQVTGPFGSISAALVDADGTEADVIEFSGTCTESVILDFPVTLQGNGGIIRVPANIWRNDGITVLSKSVTIRGKSSFTDLRILDTRYGVLVKSGAAATIDNVLIGRSFGAGIHVRNNSSADINHMFIFGSSPSLGINPVFIGGFDQGGFGDEGAGITVTQNGVALIRNSTIKDNADIGIDVHGAGLAQIDNVSVTGNDYGIVSEAGSTIEVKDANISNNSSWGIEIFAADANIIGDEDGTPGDVLVQNNTGGGINVIDSHVELSNTTVSGNGGFQAVNVYSSSIGLFGGNTISINGANGDVCAYQLGGPSTFSMGDFFAAVGNSISVTGTTDANDKALCLYGSSEFGDASVTISGGSSGIAIQASDHTKADFWSGGLGVTITGNATFGAYALGGFNSGVSFTGDLILNNASGVFVNNAITGSVTVNNDAKLFLQGSISGNANCNGLTAEISDFGGTVSNVTGTDNTQHRTCGIFANDPT